MAIFGQYFCPSSKYRPNIAFSTLAARGLEERRNFEELLTESVGRVHYFS
jgi:hypothetical protein